MSTQTLKFKTNIKCSGCVATVKPFFDQADGIQDWAVDLEHPDRLLTVQTAQLDEEDIIRLLREAGYHGEKA